MAVEPQMQRRCFYASSRDHVLRLPWTYILAIYVNDRLARIQRFDWDEGNSRKSVDKHGVSQVKAEQVFVNA
jgi:hypothetical protein